MRRHLFRLLDNNNVYKHINRKFPHHVAAIEAIAKSDANVRAIFDDYEELSTWMASQDRSGNQSPQELEYAEKLIRDLGTEILTHLGERNGSNR